MTHDTDKGRLDEALGRHREDLKRLFPVPPAKPTARKPAKAAALMLLAALAIGALGWLNPAYKQERFTTAVGERRAVALADGSELLLDSASAIDVRWRVFSRDVDLRAGQVLFEVSSAVYRPFVVSAGSARVRCLAHCSMSVDWMTTMFG